MIEIKGKKCPLYDVPVLGIFKYHSGGPLYMKVSALNILRVATKTTENYDGPYDIEVFLLNTTISWEAPDGL